MLIGALISTKKPDYSRILFFFEDDRLHFVYDVQTLLILQIFTQSTHRIYGSHIFLCRLFQTPSKKENKNLNFLVEGGIKTLW